MNIHVSDVTNTVPLETKTETFPGKMSGLSVRGHFLADLHNYARSV